MLEPLNKEQNILWSWAVAYGYVALKGNTFHYGIQRWRDSLVPRYTSEWQISLQNQLPADWQQLLKADVVNDKDRLGNEWQVAKRRVLYDKNKVAELRRAQQHLLQRLGRAEVVRQLEEYQVNLVRWQNAGVSEEAREYLDEHQKYIELYLQTLRESEPSA
jgi:ABC-type anion transport system duplicated permease subunit